MTRRWDVVLQSLTLFRAYLHTCVTRYWLTCSALTKNLLYVLFILSHPPPLPCVWGENAVLIGSHHI